MFGYCNKQRTGSACRITNARTLFGGDQSRQQFGYVVGRAELPSLFAGAAGKPLDEVRAGISNQVFLAPQHRWTEIKNGIGKIRKQVFQSAVAVFSLPEFFRIETDVAKNSFQLLKVLAFNLRQYLVDLFTDVCFIAVLVEVIKGAIVREYKPLAVHFTPDQFFVLA